MSVSVTYNIPTNLQLSRGPPSGLPEVTLPAFSEIYTVLNNIALSLTVDAGVGERDPRQWPSLASSGSTVKIGNGSRFYVQAAEPLTYGDIINLTNVGPNQVIARKASASSNLTPADGFCSSFDLIPAGGFTEVMLAHSVMLASNLTPGTRYFLSTSPGIITPVSPVAAGTIQQYLGVALSDTEFYFNSGYWIQH